MTIYTRILQQIGSSILISLPNDWIKKNSLAKGNSITIETNIDNTVSIYNNYQDEEIKIEFEYGQADGNQQTKNDVAEQVEIKDKIIKILLNKIFGAYLLGYNMINIHSKNQISFEDSETIKRATRKLIGLEIVDENSYNIHLQFLIDAKTLNIEKILSMMNSIITGMFKETIRSLSEGFESDLKKKIDSRDDEIDRQYFLLVRVIRTAIMNRKLASNLNLSNIDMLDYRIAANYLETAGDLIVELISYLSELKEKKQIADLIRKIGYSLEEMQLYSIEAFTSTSRDKAFKVNENYEEFKESISELKKHITSNKEIVINDTYSIAMINSISCLDKIAKCWIDITDLAKPTYMLK
ncbi:MAG TPA: phosphate uptake regulator PhoU [Candidatus Nitrosocosmicus sp.]|jgi:phosphate uptake regulator|nr:phosphate uptake regulator PhoU [Candidatus Nitrosocosmicus sp.]